MIIYRDVLDKLRKKGYSSYQLRKEKIMGESKIQNIRKNNVDIKTVNQICTLLNCQPSEIIEYVPDTDKDS